MAKGIWVERSEPLNSCYTPQANLAGRVEARRLRSSKTRSCIKRSFAKQLVVVGGGARFVGFKENYQSQIRLFIIDRNLSNIS